MIFFLNIYSKPKQAFGSAAKLTDHQIESLDSICQGFTSAQLKTLTFTTLDSKRYELKSSNWINGIYLVKVIHNNLGIFDGKLQVVK